MNRQSIEKKKIEEFDFYLQLDMNSEINVEVGDNVKDGEELYSISRRLLKASYYLPKLLSVKEKNSLEYVGRISGEYIEKGDLLAEKLSSGGLFTKKVVSGVDGVVDLGKLDKGYIEIMSEAEMLKTFSSFDAKVTDISPGVFIKFSTKAASLEYFASRNLDKHDDLYNHGITGEFRVIGDGESVYTIKDLDDSYWGKVVYVGRYLYPQVAVELYKRGAVAVITHAMDYEDFIHLTMPIIVMNGFGQMGINRAQLEILKDQDNRLMLLPEEGGSIVLVNSDGIDTKNLDGQQYFVNNLEVGDRVISEEIDRFGISGKILEDKLDEGDDYRLVQAENGDQVVMSTEYLTRIL